MSKRKIKKETYIKKVLTPEVRGKKYEHHKGIRARYYRTAEIAELMRKAERAQRPTMETAEIKHLNMRILDLTRALIFFVLYGLAVTITTIIML